MPPAGRWLRLQPTGPTPEEIAAQKKLMDDMENESDKLDSRAAAVEGSVGDDGAADAPERAGTAG